MGIKGGGVVTPLSTVRPCRRRVLPKRAFATNKNPHLNIGYLITFFILFSVASQIVLLPKARNHTK
jgi:hypothetical protein